VRHDLELEVELRGLMTRLAETDLQSEAEWEGVGRPPCPHPAQATISRFPRYAETLESLPAAERQKIREIAGIILRSHQPGCEPILQVDLVGHADRDFQRGPGFEQAISTRRTLKLQRALQQLIGNQAISSRIAWQARGLGARRLAILNPKNESERARNRRVEVILSPRISAEYPVLIKDPVGRYTWTVPLFAQAPATPSAAEYEHPLTFPDPVAVADSLRQPHKWICSLRVDFGDEVLPGPIVTGRRIRAEGSGTLISRRHVLTAGHVLLTQGPPKKDIFGNALDSTTTALSVTVIPGRDGGKVPAVEPVGRQQATKIRVSPAWQQSNATNRSFDYGLITLPEPVPVHYGFWSSSGGQIAPLSDDSLTGKIAHCSGYPGSFCPPPDPRFTVQCSDANRGTVQYQMSGDVTNVSAELLETEMNIAAGHSGSPTWLVGANGAVNLAGIASASRFHIPEVAVRIRSALLDKIRAWMREDGVQPTF